MRLMEVSRLRIFLLGTESILTSRLVLPWDCQLFFFFFFFFFLNSFLPCDLAPFTFTGLMDSKHRRITSNTAEVSCVRVKMVMSERGGGYRRIQASQNNYRSFHVALYDIQTYVC